MPRGKGEGITKIAVKGFKSIAEECEIDIRPLTILAGANSSGKSSIMQPLLLLKQTLEAPYDPGPLLLDGPNVKFTEAVQFLSTLPDGEKADRFQIQIEIREHAYLDSMQTIFRKRESGIEIIKMVGEKKSASHPPSFPAEGITLSPDMPKVRRSRCTLVPDSYHSKYSGIFTTLPDNVNREIIKSIHLPGFRGNPERIYKLTGTDHWYPGTFENYVATLIHEWQETTDERLKTLVDTLHTIELTRQVGTKKIGDVGIELQVGRLPPDSTNATDRVNIADVGCGVSRVLPVLVALIVARPSQLVYLEQPELHLHPRAQVALAQVLADAAKRGVRVVAETHSSLLLLGVQTLVAEGDLSPELVKLHWFTRREDGVTEVISADLDEAGAYGEWPEDFDDVDLKTQSRYLNAVDRLHFGKEEAS